MSMPRMPSDLHAQYTAQYEPSPSIQEIKGELSQYGPPVPNTSSRNDYFTQPPNTTGSDSSPESRDASISSCDSGSEIYEPREERIVPSGPERSTYMSLGNPFKEKRKRCRVMPQQLAELERLFLLDSSPTAPRRREISLLLGMEERQTQIWFQNRRAKAKLQDKGKRPSISAGPPDTPPELSTASQAEIHNLIHEEEPVTIIPCTELMIGTWRRVLESPNKRDLIVYVCDIKRCLTWFIHSQGFGFKMDIPFDTVLETKFTNISRGSGQATLLLSQPPLFYLEDPRPSPSGSSDRHQWKPCQDWTADGQATHTLRHKLIGSSPQLVHLLRTIHVRTTSSTPPRPPSYSVDQPPHGATKQPFRSERTGPDYQLPTEHNLVRKRLSCSDPAATTYSPNSTSSNVSDRTPPYSAPGDIQQFALQSCNNKSSSCSFRLSEDGLNQDNSVPPAPYYVKVEPVNYLGYPAGNPYGVAAGSYETVSQSYPDGGIPSQLAYPCQVEDPHQSPSPTSFAFSGVTQYDNYSHHTSPPALLTTPYYPRYN